MPEKISVFVIYAREDQVIKQRLLKHLNPLKDPYNLNIWHDDFIEPGQEWKPHIESRLEQTDLFLMLVSVDFMDSAFIHQVEFKFAIDRHKENRSVVIPVIINWCIWDIDIRYDDYTFNLSELQVLPDGGKPIDDWRTPEQAYYNIASGIRKVLSTINSNRDQNAIEQAKKEEEKKRQDKHRTQQDEQNKIDEVKRQQDEKIRRQDEKDKRKREELLRKEAIQKQIGSANKVVTKKIIYASLITLAVLVIVYFSFHKADKSPAGDTAAYSTTPTYSGESGQTSKNEIGDIASSHPVEQQKKKLASMPGASTNRDAIANTFSRFPEALAFVLKDAPNNFANVKGQLVGSEGSGEYKTKVTLYDKAFRAPSIFQDGKNWLFQFTNENNSNYESIRSSILNLLSNNNIQYEHESSASMASDRYTWGNGEYEIYLDVRKNTDEFVEVNILHRNK